MQEIAVMRSTVSPLVGRFSLVASLLGVALALAGCPPAGWDGLDAARVHIDSELPADRIRATVLLGNHVVRQPEAQDLKRLVDRLEDPDAAVRLYAINALEQVAQGRMGYQPWDPLAVRHRSVGRWRAWLAARGRGVDDSGQ
jgi:hypothetical protein